MRLLVVDTETQGLDPKLKVIEVGAALYSAENGLLTAASTLIPADGNPAEKVNKISPAALTEMDGLAAWASAMILVRTMAIDCDVVVAHRAEFDRPRLIGVDERYALKPWVCSKFDFEWPRSEKQGGSLVNIMLDHGLGVSHAHRALTDVLHLCRLFDLLGGDWLREQVRRGLREKGLFVSLAPFADKDLVKSFNFQWHDLDAAGKCFCAGDNAQLCQGELRKKWARTMAVEDAAALPFKTRRVQ